jgi:hypothetical protein
VALLLHSELPYEEARRQLGLRYGHVALRRLASLDYFFELYREWLGREGLTHSPANFRRWAEHEYCPGPCRAAIEPLDVPRQVPAGRPFATRLRFRNTSVEAWQMRASVSAGVRAIFIVTDSHGDLLSRGQAGVFDAVVAPGRSIDLTLPVAAVREPGRYLLRVELSDDAFSGFGQVGSEPLEWDFEVREQGAAAGR